MTKIGKFLGVVFLSYLSLLQTANAAGIQTRISQSQVGIGDVFTVSVDISFKDGANPKLEIYEIPKHPKISFLQQSQGVSIQSSFSNGVTTTEKTVTLNMVFYAKDVGQVVVPSIKLKINNKVFKAKGFKIQVTSKSSSQNQPKSKGSRNQNPMEQLFKDFFGSETPDFFGKNNPTNSNLDFFVDVETSTLNPYYGEQFTANWYLYTNGRVTDIDTLKYPALQGFWKDEISLATSLTPESVDRNGRMFTRYLLASYALTPIVQDSANIDPYEVKCQLVGGIFSFGAKELVRKSDEALVKIKPLPTYKPENFTGAVGDFKVSAVLEDQSFKVGQPFTYRIRVSGKGQLKFMELPDLGLTEDKFVIYDTSEDSQFTPPRKSVKTYQILVVPKQKGALTLPPIEFGFFDPEKSSFYTMTTRPIEINVDQADEILQDIVNVDQASRKKIFQPQLYKSISSSPSFIINITGLTSYLICFLAFLTSLAIVLFNFFKSQITYDFAKDLRQRFQTLETLIEESKWREASTLAVNIVYFYVNAKSKRKPKSQKLEDILAVLPVGLRRGIEETLRGLNTDLQKYSFAPEDLLKNSDVKSKVLEKSLALKELLERSSEDES